MDFGGVVDVLREVSSVFWGRILSSALSNGERDRPSSSPSKRVGLWRVHIKRFLFRGPWTMTAIRRVTLPQNIAREPFLVEVNTSAETMTLAIPPKGSLQMQ